MAIYHAGQSAAGFWSLSFHMDLGISLPCLGENTASGTAGLTNPPQWNSSLVESFHFLYKATGMPPWNFQTIQRMRRKAREQQKVQAGTQIQLMDSKALALAKSITASAGQPMMDQYGQCAPACALRTAHCADVKRNVSSTCCLLSLMPVSCVLTM